MPRKPDDPRSLFDVSIPRAVQSDILLALRELYPRSYRDTARLVQPSEIRDLYPFVRRGQIEGAVRSIAEKHGLSARVETNSSGNTHSVIEGGNFFLTISAVGDPSATIRPAVFRKADALYNQPLFASLAEQDTPADDTTYCAILQHGPFRSKPDQLGHALIIFPTPNGKLDCNINLIARFPDAVSVGEPFNEEIIPDSIEPQIRNDLLRKCGEDE